MRSFNLNFYTSDAVTLAYSIYGEGTPILFLAGYSGTTYSWSAQTEFFSQAGFQCIHLDKRGHGQNTDILSGLRISRLAQDIKELVTLLDIKHFHLVSHSLGAGVAYEYISLFGESELLSLTVIDVPPKAINTDKWQLGMYNLTWHTISETVANFSHVALTAKKIETDLLRQMHQGHYKFNFLKTAPLVSDFLTKDYRDVLTTLTRPTLYIAGELSPLFPKKLTQYYQDSNPHVTTFTAKACGHLPYAESPEETNQVMLDFISKY